MTLNARIRRVAHKRALWVLTMLACLPGAAAQLRMSLTPKEIVEQRVMSGPRGNPERRAKLEELFENAGCRDDRLTTQAVKRSKLPNVICSVPGTSDSVIIVGAHFDNEGSGAGIVDNWGSAALLPSLYETLAAEPRGHTFRLIGFTDEEKGLIGSQFYADQIAGAELPGIRAMVNVDTIGLGPPALWLSRADVQLAGWFYQVAGALGMPKLAVNVERVGSSDSESFRRRKVPSLTVHALTQETLSILHTKDDTVERIDMDHVYATYQLLSAYLILLDSKLP